MLLVLTNSQDQTANYFCSFLTRKNAAFLRLNTDEACEQLKLTQTMDHTFLDCELGRFEPSRFSTVWCRRPEPLVVRQESIGGNVLAYIQEEWTAALAGYLAQIEEQHWVNHPSRNAEAGYKTEQLRRASQCHLGIPATLLTQDPNALRSFWLEHDKRIIVKPLASGSVRRNNSVETESIIYTRRVLEDHLEHAGLLHNCPTLFQEEIQKDLDVRITMIDGEAVACGLRGLDGEGRQQLDIRRDGMSGVMHDQIPVPPEVANALRGLVASYGLRFAAIDMAIDISGKWVFFEINPNGQWAWMDLLGTTNIAEMLFRALCQREGR